MESSFWVNTYWVAGFLSSVCLLAALSVKARWNELPVFFLFAVFQVFRTVILFLVRSTGNTGLYFFLFWSLAIFDYLLQLGIVLELGIATLSSIRPFRHETKIKAVLYVVGGTLFPAMISFLVVARGTEGAWDTRVSLFTSLVVAQSYLALSTSANQLGISRKTYVLAVGNGLALWNVVALLRDGFYAYFGWNQKIQSLEHAQALAFILATVYWAIALSRNDPLASIYTGRETAYRSTSPQLSELNDSHRQGRVNS